MEPKGKGSREKRMSARKTYQIKTEAGIAYVTTNAHHSARAAKRALMYACEGLTDFCMVPISENKGVYQ